MMRIFILGVMFVSFVCWFCFGFLVGCFVIGVGFSFVFVLCLIVNGWGIVFCICFVIFFCVLGFVVVKFFYVYVSLYSIVVKEIFVNWFWVLRWYVD